MNEKWILYKHTCDIDRIFDFAESIKYSTSSNVGKSEKLMLQKIQHLDGDYTPRRNKDPGKAPNDSMLHRVNTLKYWFFGHVEESSGFNDTHRFIFSPLGNLFLKYAKLYKDNPDSNEIMEKLSKIFLCMLFGIQFPTPANSTPEKFKLFPFRLLFKLLTDERLDGKLYTYELYTILVFVEAVNEKEYESIVKSILTTRRLTDSEKAAVLRSDEATYVKCIHEWNYTLALFENLHLIKRNHGDTIIAKLAHPTRKSETKPTYRNATNGFIEFNASLKDFCFSLLQTYSPFATPLALDNPNRLREDVVKEIYNFLPSELLRSIGEKTINSNIADLVNHYAAHPDIESAYDFENVLCEAFNSFDGVTARHLGGAGRTDIECIYEQVLNSVEKITYKFDIEAKSTEKSLSQINAGRLRSHARAVGSSMTIVVTPNYAPAVKEDIKDSSIVILLSNTLAEYLINSELHNNHDFEDFLKIIKNNPGTDISEKVSRLTFARYSVSLQPA